ncbi:alcohol dehydrogenase catalytic domain-containing protein [Aquincola sp. MAHUQ-54]|uniref:Alcohol dehydrogenase catalytic domain-containing protein n=1 Tax=Aquincola agrisoli TaxID=3119538 RepID=A0AAW9QM91_9BURK
MLALRKTAPAPGLVLQDVAEPGRPEAGEVLIEVAAAGICGSDVHVYDWTDGYAFMSSRLPVTLGHEFCGRIAAVGPEVSGLAEGDLVAPIPTIGCMRCTDCAAGFPQRCNFRRTVGLTRDGAFARFVRVPALSCVKLHPGTDPVLAALLEPLCVGDNAANVGDVHFGDVVLVLGPGTIGQAIARAASWRGAAQVVVAGMNDTARLATALQVGATDTLDLALFSNLRSAFLALTNGREADVVFEATGHPASIADGLSVLRKDGVLVSAGIHATPAQIDLTALVRNRQQLRGAHASRRPSWEIMARRLIEMPEQVRPFVSLQLGLEDAIGGFERSRARDVSKVVLRPGGVPA